LAYDRSGVTRTHLSANSRGSPRVSNVPTGAAAAPLPAASNLPGAILEAPVDQGELMNAPCLNPGLKIVLTLLLLAPGLSSDLIADEIQIFDYEVVEKRAINRENFTQGLLIWNDALWVSSGLYGESFIARSDWPSMTNRSRKNLPQKMLVIDPQNLSIISTIPLPGEGWGVTSDGKQLYVSNGSAQLSVWKDRKQVKTINVTLNKAPVSRLNELEWINGEIWANVWLTDHIVRIDPTSGQISSIIDASRLLPADERQQGTDVLNGIAFDPRNKGIWLSGKRWPYLYRIKPVERSGKKP
jgi:glutaminyl-peptide cyclotransferase